MNDSLNDFLVNIRSYIQYGAMMQLCLTTLQSVKVEHGRNENDNTIHLYIMYELNN